MMTKRYAANALRRAAKLVEERGLSFGKYWLGRPENPRCVCAVGAISYAVYGSADPFCGNRKFSKNEEVSVLTYCLGRFIGGTDSHLSVFSWSDSSNPAEVASKMRKLARHLEHGGSL